MRLLNQSVFKISKRIALLVVNLAFVHLAVRLRLLAVGFSLCVLAIAHLDPRVNARLERDFFEFFEVGILASSISLVKIHNLHLVLEAPSLLFILNVKLIKSILLQLAKHIHVRDLISHVSLLSPFKSLFMHKVPLMNVVIGRIL